MAPTSLTHLTVHNMNRTSRRQFLAGSIALATATAGCLSGGQNSNNPLTPEDQEFGTVAESTTPAGGDTLPAPVAGDPDADVTVIAYEDYACPHCSTYSLEVFPEIAADYLEDSTIRYEFHDFPIPVDETVSWEAANAARAVQANAGTQAFYVYSERLFRNQTSLGPSAYASLTDGLDVDDETVRQAATSREYDQTIEADKQEAIDIGVEGTPTVFVNGEPIQWQEIAYEPVHEAIESALS